MKTNPSTHNNYSYPINFRDKNSSYGLVDNCLFPKIKVLDLGCNDGSLINQIKNDYQAEVAGADYNQDLIKIAKNKKLNVTTDDLNQPNTNHHIYQQQYDLVLLLDVLEHLNPHPDKLFTLLPKLLRKDGQLIVTLPNVNHIDVIIKMLTDGWEYQPNGLLDATHLHFYSPAELQTLLLKHGLYLTNIHLISAPPGASNLLSLNKPQRQVLKVLHHHHLIKRSQLTFQTMLIFTKNKSAQIKLDDSQITSSHFKYYLKKIMGLLLFKLEGFLKK